MKAILFEKSHKPDQWRLQEIDKPNPLENEVLVKIHAVSVNTADYRSMQLGIIPKKKIFGSDIAGVVEAIGNHVKSLRVGDAVFGDLSANGFGGFAEYTTAPESVLVKKPAGLTFEMVVAIPMAAVTALQAIRDKGQVHTGQDALIIGSGGGVGTFAVQFAKYYGAKVTAVCSTKNVQISQSLGADHVLDYSKQDFLVEGKKYEVIIVVNGNRPLRQYKKVLKPHGLLVVVGGSISQVLKT